MGSLLKKVGAKHRRSHVQATTSLLFRKAGESFDLIWPKCFMRHIIISGSPPWGQQQSQHTTQLLKNIGRSEGRAYSPDLITYHSRAVPSIPQCASGVLARRMQGLDLMIFIGPGGPSFPNTWQRALGCRRPSPWLTRMPDPAFPD